MSEKDVVRRVRDALCVAGERESRVRRTQSTGRLHYIGDGFRLHLTFDGPTFLPKDTSPQSPSYVGVGTADSRMGDLRRYEQALKAAGMPAQITGTHRHKSVRVVWVAIPIARGGTSA